MTKLEMILEYFKANEEVFNDCIYDLYQCTDHAKFNDEDIYWSTELFGEEFYSEIESIVVGIAHGHDEETGGPFDIKRMYYRRDEDGNYISTDTRNYKKFMTIDTILDMAKEYQFIYTITENKKLKEMFSDVYDEIFPKEEEPETKPEYRKTRLESCFNTVVIEEKSGWTSELNGIKISFENDDELQNEIVEKVLCILKEHGFNTTEREASNDNN